MYQLFAAPASFAATKKGPGEPLQLPSFYPPATLLFPACHSAIPYHVRYLCRWDVSPFDIPSLKTIRMVGDRTATEIH